MTFKLRSAQLTSESMSGHSDKAVLLAEELLRQARTRSDMAAAHILRGRLHGLTGNSQGAVNTLLECLRKFGMPLSPTPSEEELRQAEEELELLLQRHALEELLSRPSLTDPELAASIDVLSALSASALFANVRLSALAALQSAILSIRHGNTEASANSYVLCSTWYGSSRQKYGEARVLGKLALLLNERSPHSPHKIRVLNYSATIQSLSIPFSQVREIILAAFRESLLRGDAPGPALVASPSSETSCSRVVSFPSSTRSRRPSTSSSASPAIPYSPNWPAIPCGWCSNCEGSRPRSPRSMGMGSRRRASKHSS
ncbi:hypothetical protein ACN28S_09390 [Cystobacter fuscus]